MFVTGGRGLLGRHLQRSPAIERWELIAPGSRALDIRQRDRVLDEIADWRPTCVVHLAYRNDDRRTIVDGSRNVADAAARCGARLIHLSTDAVFAGRPAPYTEADPPFAITEYGRMKADAEAAVMTACPTAVVVRTSLMYATDSLAPVQLDVQRAARGESTMSFFTDEYRCPAHAADVAAACGALASMPHVVGPLHVAGPDALSRAEFAAAIARWLGLNPAQLRTSALTDSGLVRPGRLVLDSSRADALGIRCRPVSAALAAS
jgi:dTDP-4-dehydrorhamnose reductase